MPRRPLHSDTFTHGVKLADLRREFRNVYAQLGEGLADARLLPLPPDILPPGAMPAPGVLNWDFGTLDTPTGPSVDFGDLFNPNPFTADFGGL